MTATTTHPSPTAVARPSRVLAVMCAGMFLVLLDVTIVNVALPSIRNGFDASTPLLQWVVDGYVVAIAGLLLAGGTIGDRIGHRRVLLTGFGIFGAASLICALAPAIGVLIAGRIVQGVGGALLLPSTMAVIVDVYPDRTAQAKAIGTWAAISSLALPAGPLLGGLLVGWLGWRPVFWLNVPLTALAIAAALLVVPDRPGRRHGDRLDIAGLAGFVVGLGGLVFTVISVGHHANIAIIAISATLTCAALTVAVLSARHAPHPVLPLDLLRRRDFRAPNEVALIMNLVFNGLLFVITRYLQEMQHYSPLAAGASVLPMAVPLVVLAPFSGRLTAQRGPRPALVLGCLLAITGSTLLTQLHTHSEIGWLLAGLTLLGCGAGFTTTAAVAAVVRATPPDRSGLATGVSNTSRQIGTASGVAIFGALAGTPNTPHFANALPFLAIGAALLWTAALLISFVAVDHNQRP
ncbi:MFS transporter [Nocardia arthritidis]|uniref:MFS transporter n=1 Tax=Nocardia arthritidis TaxID=228602 RepID=A0A6G9Y429_9NOCA|nr:MFS transporter [Nocardia arthritidis]QIS07951.1 MFS transporter [Nocardia arthritidis]